MKIQLTIVCFKTIVRFFCRTSVEGSGKMRYNGV